MILSQTKSHSQAEIQREIQRCLLIVSRVKETSLNLSLCHRHFFQLSSVSRYVKIHTFSNQHRVSSRSKDVSECQLLWYTSIQWHNYSTDIKWLGNQVFRKYQVTLSNSQIDAVRSTKKKIDFCLKLLIDVYFNTVIKKQPYSVFFLMLFMPENHIIITAIAISKAMQF